MRLNPTERRLAGAASISDLRVAARRRAPRAVFDYTDGAAGDEYGLRRSREAYARVEFQPQVLRDVSVVDVTTTILGRPAAAPLVFAPTGFTRMMHTEGEPAVARVAARTGIPYALSTMGTTSIERRAPVVPALSVARPRGEPRLRRQGQGCGVRGTRAHRGLAGSRPTPARHP
jgi:L-lactate dehydrogenase (cytochrome)